MNAAIFSGDLLAYILLALKQSLLKAEMQSVSRGSGGNPRHASGTQIWRGILKRGHIQERERLAQAVSRRLFTVKARVRFQISPWEICGGHVTGTGFSPIPSVFPCQYNSTAAPYSLVYLGDRQRAR
jgi:hypothetical protein